ncbi:MAG: YeeE/YedE family protein, partial [Pseudohongiella sp.]|nr:YeeE/YedE family protein [Pseudohongiella sp.]
GQGNYDAIAGIAGLMAGSYVYAETSDYLSATIQRVGDRGRIMLPDLLSMRVTVFLVILVPLLIASLFVLQRLMP